MRDDENIVRYSLHQLGINIKESGDFVTFRFPKEMAFRSLDFVRLRNLVIIKSCDEAKAIGANLKERMNALSEKFCLPPESVHTIYYNKQGKR